MTSSSGLRGWISLQARRGVLQTTTDAREQNNTGPLHVCRRASNDQMMIKNNNNLNNWWTAYNNNNSNNNNNNRVYIYGAVIMASHCESSPGSFDECRLSAEVAANPQTKPTNLDCASAERKAATVHIHHRHLLLLSPRADTHFTVPRRVEGWVDLGTAVSVRSPCPRLYIAVTVVINTTACGEIRTWVL